MNTHSIALRSKLDRLAARDPIFAKSLAAVRDRYGQNWDPSSTLAKRLRVVRYAEGFLRYLADFEAAGCHASDADAAPLLESYFATTRELLTKHCDSAFGALTIEQALATVKPKRGPTGAAGVAAKWGASVNAFNDRDADTAAKRYRQAVRDCSPARRARSRAK